MERAFLSSTRCISFLEISLEVSRWGSLDGRGGRRIDTCTLLSETITTLGYQLASNTNKKKERKLVFAANAFWA